MYIPHTKYRDMSQHFLNQCKIDKQEKRTELTAINRDIKNISFALKERGSTLTQSNKSIQLKKQKTRLKKDITILNQKMSKILPLIKLFDYHVRTT